jgi:hypothetical protein
MFVILFFLRRTCFLIAKKSKTFSFSSEPSQLPQAVRRAKHRLIWCVRAASVLPVEPEAEGLRVWVGEACHADLSGEVLPPHHPHPDNPVPDRGRHVRRFAFSQPRPYVSWLLELRPGLGELGAGSDSDVQSRRLHSPVRRRAVGPYGLRAGKRFDSLWAWAAKGQVFMG